MQILDSNIIIYSTQPEYAYLRSLIKSPESFASRISYIEVLGYHSLTPEEKRYFEGAFRLLTLLPVSIEVMERATQIRQIRKYSLGDSIIAATALVYDLELYTRNVRDFQSIPGLKLNNPIRQ